MQTQARRGPRRLLRAVAAVMATASMGLGGTAYAALPPGVDVSSYQHGTSLNWASVAASGVKFAFVKATEGTGYVNPYFSGDWSATAAAGIYRGAYHFARPSVGSGPAQAQYFAHAIGSQKGSGTLPPVLDLEATGGLSPSQLIAWTHAFLSTVQQVTGRTPMIYVSPAFWRDHLNDDHGFHAYPLWIANYGVSAPSVPGGWSTWSFWQTTSTARVSGISGSVDSDVFNGSLAQLAKFASGTSVPAAQATTVSLRPSTTTPTAGQSVTFTGALLTSAGAAVAGRSVAVQSQAPGSSTWATLGTATTSSTGAYALTSVVRSTGTYRATFVGDNAYSPTTSPTSSLTLAPPASTASVATMSTSTPTTYAGTPLLLTGTLRGAHGMPLGGRTLSLLATPAGGATRTLRQLTTTSDGTFSTRVSPLPSTAYEVHYAGDSASAPTTSSPVPVTTLLRPTASTLTFSTRAPYAGQTVTVSGALSAIAGAPPGSAGLARMPVRSRTLELQRELTGSSTWASVGSVLADATGHFTTSQVVSQGASYRALFAGDTRFGPSTSSATPLTIAAPSATRQLLAPASRTRRTLHRGQTATIAGQLETQGGAPLPGRTVSLYMRLAGTTSWRLVTHTVTTATRGQWSFLVRPTSTCQFRIVSSGDAELASAASRLVRFRVV